MLQLPVPDVIKKICEERQLKESEVKDMIKEKLGELSGLISEEGAAYIIASELGISLFKDLETEGRLKIKNVLVGMRNVDVIGRIIRVSEPRTFKKGDKVGQVGSLIIADDTDQIRIVIWDERVSWLGNKLKEGTVIGIRGAYSKESNMGGKELHLNIRSQIILNPEVDIELPIEIKPSVIKKALKDAAPNDRIRAAGTVVQVFSPRFYPTCPTCGRSSPGNKCAEHGEIQPKDAMVLSLVLDDGTTPMRCTAFSSQAERLIDTKPEDAKGMDIMERIEEFLLGREIAIEGRVVLNEKFGKIELQISSADVNLDPKSLCSGLVDTDNRP